MSAQLCKICDSINIECKQVEMGAYVPGCIRKQETWNWFVSKNELDANLKIRDWDRVSKKLKKIRNSMYELICDNLHNNVFYYEDFYEFYDYPNRSVTYVLDYFTPNDKS